MAAANARAAQVTALDRRGAERLDLAVWSRIRTAGRPDQALRICNTSPEGIMAMTPAPVSDGDRVQIELPTIGWHDAKIVWSLGDRIGAAFLRPIDPDTYDRFMAFHR